jgi:hypothetical protein
VTLAVHAGLLVMALDQRVPVTRDAARSSLRAVEIELQHDQRSTRKAASPSAAAPASPVRASTSRGAPAPFAAPQPAPLPPILGVGPPAATGAAPGPLAQAGPGVPGTPNGPPLKFDCPPGGDLTRAGAVRANPCAFRGAARDHLPEAVAKQARIDSGKAAYYDRVLDANERMRNDPSYGNPPFFTCRIQFGGGKGVASAHPPHTYKFGKLPCYLIPPHGNLDPDVFVEPPPPKHPRQPGEMAE